MKYKLYIIKCKLVKLFVQLTHKNIRCASSTIIEGKCEFKRDGNIEIGEKTVISRWSCFRPWGGYIRIGENCSVNSFCFLSGNGGIEIGDNVRIATQCVLVSANHNFDRTDVPITFQGETAEKITIEDDCWLGAGAKILSGVTIGKGSVVAACAVVSKNVPEYSVVAGVPAKMIRSRYEN